MDNKEDKQAEQPEEVEGNIIDVEPEVETPASTAASGQSNTDGKKSQLPLILAVIAMVLVAASWIAGYRYWHNILNDLSSMQNRISSTHEQQQALDAEIAKAKQVLQEQTLMLETQAQQTEAQSQQMNSDKEQITRQAEVMQKAVDQVNEKIGRSSDQWQLAEAAYLMSIANHKLALTQDINTALAALEQADNKLLDSGDLGLLAVREKLAEEIGQLKAIRQVDIAGIAASLQSLAQQVGQLKLASAALTPANTASDGENEQAMGRSLDTLLSDSWRGFRELMVIRKHDQPVSAMLPPSQQYFIYQNLQLQLESARLALLRQESILFKSSLDTATEWLTSFFDQEDTATSNMLTTLNRLKQTELNPAMPNISASLNLLNQYRESSK